MDNRSGVQLHRYGPLTLYALSVVVGVVGALAAVVFRGMIAFFHNLFFLRQFSLFYDANVHRVIGAARPSDLQSRAAKLDDLIDKCFVFVGENDQLLQVMSRMRAAGAIAALVTAKAGDSLAQNVLGMIGKPQIADAVIGGLELFSD